MIIIRLRKIFFALTGVILAASVGAILIFGLPLGIDFTGGSLLEVEYVDARPPITTLQEGVSSVSLGEVSIRESGEKGVLLRFRSLTPAEHDAVLTALSLGGSAKLTELQFTSVGPSLGSELGKKALWAIGAVILTIVFYIAWAFRKVSRPVSSWIYGLTVVAILIHDIVVPAGFYALWSAFTGAEVDSLFVVALLAILGYSVNDTIVIFDRVRENLSRNEKTSVREPFDEVVGRSITETLTRSINTSLTVVLALLALIFLGSAATLNFSLVLLIGVIAGTYSSILLAAPLLVPLARRFAKS